MSEANNCCGTTCDKSKLTEDIARVVAAFDGFEEAAWRLQHVSGEAANAIGELKRAIACLREKP